jgi:hypothetical protein
MQAQNKLRPSTAMLKTTAREETAAIPSRSNARTTMPTARVGNTYRTDKSILLLCRETRLRKAIRILLPAYRMSQNVTPNSVSRNAAPGNASHNILKIGGMVEIPIAMGYVVH